MTEIKDNPPPLDKYDHPEHGWVWTELELRYISKRDAAAFARGVAAMQSEIDELRAERIAAYELGRNAGQEVIQRERESFKAFLREMHADHNDQHNHFQWALNEWVRRTEATQGETK